MIEAGQQAPEFTLPDQDGNAVSLADFRGKPVVVYFYPKDDTPGCTKEACSFRDNWSAIGETGAVVLGISADSQESHRTFRGKHELPFTLLSDPGLDVIKAFGAWGTKKMYGKEYEGIMRYTFIIDGNGVVSHVFLKPKTAVHAEEVLEKLTGG